MDVITPGTDAEHVILLFPNEIDKNNHIAAGGAIDLPRPGWSMVAGGPAGTNHFIALVTENPRDFAKGRLVKVGPFAEFAFGLTARGSQSGEPSPFLGQSGVFGREQRLLRRLRGGGVQH